VDAEPQGVRKTDALTAEATVAVGNFRRIEKNGRVHDTGESQMAGKFELFKDKAGEFRFRLKAGNGETILASEGYKQRASAMNGIESVRKNAADDGRFERKDSTSGKPMFNLKAKNGQVIGTSELYSSASSRDAGIESVKKNAPKAVVADLT
jgi:uncharacterized protein YegP (UPF0339 family)